MVFVSCNAVARLEHDMAVFALERKERETRLNLEREERKAFIDELRGSMNL